MPSPVHKAVDEKERQIEEGEAAGARTKVEEKTASPAMRPLISPVQSPVRVSAKTTVEREILSNAAGAVKVKDFASPAFAGPASAAATSAPIAELQAPMSPTASKPSSKPTDTAPQAISATKPLPFLHFQTQPASLPPRYSVLSSHTVRPTALLHSRSLVYLDVLPDPAWAEQEQGQDPDIPGKRV